jgi:hypothetical protein
VPPFRYYIPEQGRWLTPDPLAGDITKPQSLNRYAYVGNNPTSFIDPSGLLGKCTYGGTWPRCNSRPHSTPYSPPPNPCPNGQWDRQTGVLICNPPQPPGPPQYGPPPQGAHVGGSGTPLATSQRNPAPEPALVRVDPLQDLALLAFGVKGLAALLDALLSEGSEEAVVLSEDRLTSILEKHTAEGVLSQGKSLFAEGEDVEALIQAANPASAVPQSFGGNFQIVTDAGRAIGTDLSGQATSAYTVIIDANGEVVTAFPGLPTR